MSHSDPDFDESLARKDDDDDEFGFEESYEPTEGKHNHGATAKSTVVANQHYDEEVSIDSSTGSLSESASMPAPKGRGDSPPAAEESGRGEYATEEPGMEIPGHRDRDRDRGSRDYGGYGDDDFGSAPAARAPAPAPAPAMGSISGVGAMGADPDDSSSDSSSDEEGGGAPGGAVKEGGYNPADYAHLSVDEDVRELFLYIGRYKPHNIELDSKIKCFIPEYIPAVGEIDAFIKPSRPDGEAETLGLKLLDEPSAQQSNPTVLDLQLRAMSKKSNLEPMMVRSIEQADKSPEEVLKWIKSISDLHRNKPPPQVHYTKAMPDIERLMQVWPDSFEVTLKECKLPGADINMSLAEYARVICAILDIPVYTSTIQSLHVLFTLYSEFRSNQHFMNMGGAGEGAGAGVPGAMPVMGGGGGPDVMSMTE